MKDSQVKQIYAYLKSGGRITGLQAIKKFGSLKLPNRIGEVEEQYNVTVDRRWIKVKTPSETKRVMEYFITPKPTLIWQRKAVVETPISPTDTSSTKRKKIEKKVSNTRGVRHR